MKRFAIIAALFLAACATPGEPTLMDAIVFNAQVDPASIRDPARFQQDVADCKVLANQNSWLDSFAGTAMKFRRCLAGRGYSVL